MEATTTADLAIFLLEVLKEEKEVLVRAEATVCASEAMKDRDTLALGWLAAIGCDPQNRQALTFPAGARIRQAWPQASESKSRARRHQRELPRLAIIVATKPSLTFPQPAGGGAPPTARPPKN